MVSEYDIINIYKGEDMRDIELKRAWAMPNKNTFDIAPIRKMLGDEVDTDDLWIDPFANQNKIARITNDLNPIFDTDYNLDALDFLKIFDDYSVDGVLYDPPYSPRQISECYKGVGLEVSNKQHRPLSGVIKKEKYLGLSSLEERLYPLAGIVVE